MNDQVKQLSQESQEPHLDLQTQLEEILEQRRQLEKWQQGSARRIDQLHMQRDKACVHPRHLWPRS